MQYPRRTCLLRPLQRGVQMQAFGDAAALLQNRPLSAENESGARELLARLGFDLPALESEGSGSQNIEYTAALFHVAERMSRIFSLSAPDAPGLVFVGG